MSRSVLVFMLAVLTVAWSRLAAAGSGSPDVHSGQYAVKIVNRTQGAFVQDTALDLSYHMVSVTAQHDMTFSFWIKSGNAEPSRVLKIQIAYFSKKTDNVQFMVAFQDFNSGEMIEPNWSKYTFTLKVPDKAKYANVSFRADAGGDPPHALIIDDVSLKDITSGSLELMENGGFEKWAPDRTDGPELWRFFSVERARGQIMKMVSSVPRSPSPTPASEITVTWEGDLAAATARAAAEQKKMLVYFVVPGSQPALHYDSKVFADSRVRELLRTGFVSVRIDLLQKPQVAQTMQAFKSGTINVYDSKGNAVAQFTQKLTADQLLQELRKY